VLVARLPADVEVQAYGYRSRVLTGVAADCEVTLDHGIPARLSAGVRGRSSAPAYQLLLYLYDVDASGKVGGMTAVRTWPTSLTSSTPMARSTSCCRARERSPRR
jgi:hypothetical protein